MTDRNTWFQRSRKGLLGVFLLSAPAAFDAARADAEDRFPRIRIVSENRIAAAPEAEAYWARLRGLAARQDLDAILAEVSPGFRWDRDFGGGFRRDASGAENFITAIGLDNPYGWSELDRLLGARDAGAGGEDGEYCAPAEVGFASPADETRAEATDLFWFAYGYVAGTGVAVRAEPSRQSEKLDFVSNETVKISDWEPVEAGDGAWIAVVAPSGAEGYVFEPFIESFLSDRLCIGPRPGGGWAITAYVGGGD